MTQLNADHCYIFTDTETTGLDINFSQILQVGSLLTDENLVVEKEHSLFSKLLPWIVPSPEAFLVHKKTRLNCAFESTSSRRRGDSWLPAAPSSAPPARGLAPGFQLSRIRCASMAAAPLFGSVNNRPLQRITAHCSLQ